MVSTKVGAGALAGAICTIVIWIIEATTGVEIPATVAAALVVVVTFGLGYFVPETAPAPSARDAVKADDSHLPAGP